jgi:hypothetical protein
MFLLLLLGAFGGTAYLYHEHNGPDRIREDQLRKDLEASKRDVETQRKRAEEFKLFADRLKATHRVAEVIVRDPAYSSGGLVGEWLVFTELDENGNELNSREYWIEGKQAHIDAEVIKFDKSKVEQGDLLKGQSLVLFRSLYDSKTSPDRAKEIDKEGEIPPIYRTHTGAASDFEKDLWAKFWDLANDPEYRKSKDVSNAQGESVWRDFEFGYKYKITVDAAGGLNITNEKLPAGVIQALKGHQKANPSTQPAQASQ